MSTDYTSDIDDAFFPQLEEVADELQARPKDLLSVWYSESGVKATAHNDGPPGAPYEKRYHASGIFQAMPATLMGMGWTAGHEVFRALTATEQLQWAYRYYRPYVGKLVSIGAVYTATFLPALIGHAGDPAFVLTAKNGPLPWAFAPNATFDANHDLAITVGELEQAVLRNCRGPRWSELVARLEGTDAAPDTEAEGFDLGTVRGLQSALARLGYDPGVIDGLPGRKTTAALIVFQAQRGLKPDGVYGPLSRAALSVALATAA